MERKTIPAEGSAPRKKRKTVTANRKRHSDVVTPNRKDQAEVVTALKKGQPKVIMSNVANHFVDWDALLAGINGGKSILEYSENRVIFHQGDPADAIFYLRRGKVKLAVTSQQGREAIVAVLGAGEFFGEGCLAGQLLCVSTAVAVTDCTLARIEKAQMARMLHNQHDISELFVTHLLSRNIRYEEDLVDQLFNSSEKRLARILLLLAHFGKEGRSEDVLPRVNQENLAQMVGTTRSRVSHFMNKFKKLGFVDYDGSNGGLTVHSGLLSVILRD
ncbi:MAG: Crp/Fnr family transcriptional regulator [Terriglobia bacterium]